MAQDTLTQSIDVLCQNAKCMATVLARMSAQQKQQVLMAMADHIQQQSDAILTVNQQDVASAKKANVSPAFIDRLTLSSATLLGMIDSIRRIAAMPDPVGKTLASWSVDSGLQISRVTIPIGVIAIIYESRPNVTADAAALCIKSGNAVILRGGSDCVLTNQKIVDCLQQACIEVGVPKNVLQYIPIQDRAAIDVLLKMDEYIDVVIPRGGRSLIQHIRDHSRIPVFSHLEGICHTYVHQAAQVDMAIKVILNAKMRRPGICGATETVLIDQAIAATVLPRLIDALCEHECEVRGDDYTQSIDSRVLPASGKDWSTEYLAAIVSIKVVNDIHRAIEHIAQYGSNHTESIITDDKQAAQLFQSTVNSAIVMHNCSTQFADGGEFGMGAEIGIATGKLHARGPVGIEQLTTYKYIVSGEGQVRP